MSGTVTAPVTLTGNEAEDSRQASCDDGSVATDGGGNNFAVGGVVTCDAID